jgi:NAD(P)-dependent dehydrogenase (short-subunit alcohol dehydrogenase family)
MEWRNQVAVVTGGSRGIGRATVRLLAQHGAAVCVNYAAQVQEPVPSRVSNHTPHLAFRNTAVERAGVRASIHFSKRGHHMIAHPRFAGQLQAARCRGVVRPSRESKHP